MYHLCYNTYNMLLETIKQLGSPANIKVYFTLLKIALPTMSTYATNRTIANYADISPQRVTKALKKLQDLNIIRIYNERSIAYRKIQINIHHLSRLKASLEDLLSFIYVNTPNHNRT